MTTYSRRCPKCNAELFYKSARHFSRATEYNTLCRSCCKKKGLSEDLNVTCPRCKQTRTYSNKYNAAFARDQGRCRSCSTSSVSVKKWKDESYQEKMKAVLSEARKTRWEKPDAKKKAAEVLSARNLQNWKNDEYRDIMYEKIRLNSIRGMCGTYKGHHFRSSLELYFMINFLEGKEWVSCEKSEFAIKYEHEGRTKTYYPDFLCEGTIYEIKGSHEHDDPIVISKKRAAETWCSERGYAYMMIDPGRYKAADLYRMHDEGLITLSKRHKKAE